MIPIKDRNMIKLQSFPFQAPNHRSEIPEPHHRIATSRPHHCHIKTFPCHNKTRPQPHQNLSLPHQNLSLPHLNHTIAISKPNLDISLLFTMQLHDFTIYINIEKDLKYEYVHSTQRANFAHSLTANARTHARTNACMQARRCFVLDIFWGSDGVCTGAGAKGRQYSFFAQYCHIELSNIAIVSLPERIPHASNIYDHCLCHHLHRQQ